jgi:hypothetical protein
LNVRKVKCKHATGEIDGIAIESRFMVLRKDHCLFDFSLIGKPQILGDELANFESLLGGFHFEGAP